MGGGDNPNSNPNLPEVQPGTRSHAQGQGEARGEVEELHGASAGAEPRSRTTPVAPTDPGNWTKPGSQAGTSEEEDFRTGPENPGSRTGPT